MLLEDQSKTVLIDPGKYTYDEKVFGVNSLEKLDFLLVTHEHPDHLYVPFVKEIVARFPLVNVITTPSIVQILAKEGIQAGTEGNEWIEISNAPHEKILVPEPVNVLFHVFGKLTHPGDSFQFSSTKGVLALPITAPWGHTLQAAEKAVQLKPRIVIPIHDWFWKDWWRTFMYQMLGKYFSDRGIDFRGMETGEVLEV